MFVFLLTRNPIMTRRVLSVIVLLWMTASVWGSDYSVKPVEFPNVKLKDGFWRPRQEINRKHSIPFAFEQCEKTGRVDNFRLVAGNAPKGYHYVTPVFNDTDIYKGIEAASFDMAVNPDPKMDAYLDHLIAIVASAQQPDGYLYTPLTCGDKTSKQVKDWTNSERWGLLARSHELYNAGHLFEAAAAHHIATGKNNFLDIATKLADMLVKTFGPGMDQIQDVPGHEVIEMGLVKLYRVTNKKEYLDLAKFFVDMRGRSDLRNSRNPNPKAMYGPYSQDHKPLVEQDEAVGHAVRATYYYAGATDTAVLCNDEKSFDALKKIWDNVVTKKLALTGGLGGTPHGEAFADNFVLRNFVGETYNETCAQIGGSYWHHRMFLADPDAKYYDVLERTIYNALISGVSLSGDHFFYPNPLASHGGYVRAPWFGCACCPQNLMRFVASLGGYVYAVENNATSGDTLYVGLYIANQATVRMGDRNVKLDMQSGFPNQGNVLLNVAPENEGEWTLALRIPGWATGKPVPSELYRYVKKDIETILSHPPKITVNGETVPCDAKKGFVFVKRNWKSGDQVKIDFAMPLVRVLCDERVVDDRDRVALEKGPLVYCFEGCDNKDGVFNLIVDAETKSLNPIVAVRPALGDSEVVEIDAARLQRNENGEIQKQNVRAVAVPYPVWGNRNDGTMQVWMSRNENSVSLPPKYSPKSTTSFARPKDRMPERLKDVHDGLVPNENRPHVPHFDWWPRLGTVEWIRYDFEKPVTITKSSVYWFDDTGTGNCRVPASWRLTYLDGNEWKPVDLKESFRYGTEKKKLHEVEFPPVSIRSIRLEVTLPTDFSSGLYEWTVE